MSRDLLAYLDCDGPLYDYLGHFHSYQYLEAGHNDLGLEEQIDAGNIPDLHSAGKNIPAQAEPGNISAQGQAGTAAGTPSSSPSSTVPLSRSGLGSQLVSAGLKTIGDLASGNADSSFSSETGESTDIGATFGENLKAGGGVGSALAGIFGI